MPTRACNNCGIEKDLGRGYYKNSRCPDGRSPRCIECERAVRETRREQTLAVARERYRQNREKERRRQKVQRQRHAERDKKRNAAYREANKDEINRRTRERRLTNPDAALASDMKHREKHRERYREHARRWAKANPDKARFKSAQRRARKRANGGHLEDRDWQRVRNRYRGQCAYCGVRPGTTMDHVIPLIRGGRHTIGNILPACTTCNYGKQRKLLIEWRVRNEFRMA